MINIFRNFFLIQRWYTTLTGNTFLLAKFHDFKIMFISKHPRNKIVNLEELKFELKKELQVMDLRVAVLSWDRYDYSNAVGIL